MFLLLSIIRSQDIDISQRTADSLYAVSFYEEGKNYYKLDDGGNALLHLEKALELFEAGEFTKQIGVVHNRIAKTYLDIFGDWKKAEQHWLTTIEIWEELNDSTWIAIAKHYLGNVYTKMDSYKKAGEYYKESLEFWEKYYNPRYIKTNLNSLGLLEIERERYYSAEKYFNQLLTFLDKNDYEVRAKVLNNLGYMAYRRGHYGKAHEFYMQSLNLYGDYFSNSDKLLILLNLGNVFDTYEDTVSARLHYYRALELSGDNKENKALVLHNIGVYHTAQKKYDQALDCLTKSLELKEEIGDRKGIVHTLTSIGNLHKQRGEKKEARTYYRRARKQARGLGYIQGESQSIYNLGLLELEEKNYDSATDYFQEGMEQAKKLENNFFGYLFNEGLGDIFSEQDRLDLSTKYYNNAIEHAEQIRRGIGLEIHRSSFMSGVMGVYRKLANVQVELGKGEEAYHTYERMKARNLLDILDGAFLVYEDEMTPEEVEKEQLMESRLRQVNRRISKYTYDDGPARSLDSLALEMRSARRKLDRFKSSLYFNHPELKRKMGEGEPLRTRQAIKLLNLNEAVIAYMVSEDKTTGFLLKREGRRDYIVETIELDFSLSEIEEMIENYLLDWERSISHDLYIKLLEPFTEYLDGVSQLCIVPDSYLNNLPFHALVNPKTNQYLIEDFVVYYVNSLSALDELRSFGTVGKEKLLAFGNPEFGEEGVTTIRGKYGPLPATEREVISIGEIYQDRATLFIGQEAKEEHFKSSAGEFGVIHLATHGLMDELNPMYSSILLTASEKDDGFLTAREILKTKMNADMVVLSACETATGKLTEGEGMLGLSRAFFGANVPALVASLWPVADESTRILMESFYREMANGLRPAKALRMAQVSLMEQPKYDHPKFWAPFIFIGDTE